MSEIPKNIEPKIEAPKTADSNPKAVDPKAVSQEEVQKFLNTVVAEKGGVEKFQTTSGKEKLLGSAWRELLLTNLPQDKKAAIFNAVRGMIYPENKKS